MIKEFKEFAFKGNVIDMAVGVVVGSAFGKIVNSLVNDIVMPFFGYVTSGMEFTNLQIQLGGAEGASIKYGNFIQNVVDFFIIAISIFFVIRLITKARTKIQRKEEIQEQEAPKKSDTELLLEEIRDLIKEGK